MSRYQNRPVLLKKLQSLPENAKILDVGGWFDPLPQATHVIDLFPYETRNGEISLEKKSEEKFSKDTWLQYNFLDKNLRFPFSDGYFEFVVCCHTLEDLEAPLNLLNELKRISKAGYIEVPSRLDEQTLGVRDRCNTQPGHPHHYWIIDQKDNSLIFYSKKASLQGSGWETPLLFTEKYSKENELNRFVEYYFETLNFSIIPEHDPINSMMAKEFTAGLKIPVSLYIKDAFLRFCRRMRNHSVSKDSTNDWYEKMIKTSEPFSAIPLR